MQDFLKWENTKKGFYLALFSIAVSIPNQYYLYFVSELKDKFVKFYPEYAIERAFIVQLSLMFFATLISAIVGFAWSEKYGLAGFGLSKKLKKQAIWLILSGILIGILYFFLFDKKFILYGGGYYPSDIFWALSVPLQSATCSNIWIRFGMLTLIYRLLTYSHYLSRQETKELKNYLETHLSKSESKEKVVQSLKSYIEIPPSIIYLHIANFLTASIFTAFTIRMLIFSGVNVGFNYLSITTCLMSFTFNLIYGYVYAKKGLVAVSIMHFVVDLRLVLWALIR